MTLESHEFIRGSMSKVCTENLQKVFGGGNTVLLEKTICAILIVGNKMEEFSATDNR